MVLFSPSPALLCHWYLTTTTDAVVVVVVVLIGGTDNGNRIQFPYFGLPLGRACWLHRGRGLTHRAGEWASGSLLFWQVYQWQIPICILVYRALHKMLIIAVFHEFQSHKLQERLQMLRLGQLYAGQIKHETHLKPINLDNVQGDHACGKLWRKFNYI